MKLLFALVLSLSAPLVCAQTVYTWVDDNGVLHMSDTPNNGAKTVKLPDLEASAPPPQVESTQFLDKPAEVAKEKPKSQQQEAKPLALTLASPSHDATIRSNQGIITIQVQTNRKLDIGEQLQLVFDGNRYGAPQTSTLWQLKNIDRGTHIIAIQAVRSGKLIASTSPISVHLHRTKIK
ncbi:TPA: DUF4124 domain-containing protein [Vibrio vulnificus]|nr:DUF4124 domain-containing protein [Vibrio vulnificus]HDY8057683.1 DUF4124 domain-containing protein [Vibrio vulnificus]